MGTPAPRLAEVLAGLSLATDLGNNFPFEKALRSCLLATSIGRRLDLPAGELCDVYYLAMLRYLGCTAFAHEMAAACGGDDNALRNSMASADFSRPGDVLSHAIRGIAPEAGPIRRAKGIAGFLASGPKLGQQMAASDCEASSRLATRLGMSAGVRHGLAHLFARWDGQGTPPTAGEDIPRSARIVQFAHTTELFYGLVGSEATSERVRARSGRDLDPHLADLFLAEGSALLECIAGQQSAWDDALAAEPAPQRSLSPEHIDAVVSAFADFGDLKSPFLLGHSQAVSRLAEQAGRVAGIEDVTSLRRAGLLHDLGRVSVASGIWDKRGSLSAGEWERVRLHTYYTQRVLQQSPLLRALADLAGMHHERLDGTGYHRGSRAADLSLQSRILAAADTYQAMTEERPHRPALSPAQAVAELQREARDGRLDHEAAGAVLEAAGHKLAHRRGDWPSGLSDREVEVLRLAAQGKPNREIAQLLSISDKTVHHHVLHIYDKVGVSTRAGAALFAMEHGLLLK